MQHDTLTGGGTFPAASKRHHVATLTLASFAAAETVKSKGVIVLAPISIAMSCKPLRWDSVLGLVRLAQ